MKVSILAILALILASLACVSPAWVVTPTATPVPSMTARPAPTSTQPATATPDADTAIVRQPSVNVRKSPGGDPTGKYIYAGQEVTILERGKGDDADWVRIADPAGWVFIGCLENMSKKGCIAK